MKRILSLLFMAIIALTSVATAKTVTFTVDNPNALNIINLGTYQTLIFDTGETSKSIELSEYAGVQVNAATGYQINSITINSSPLSNVSPSGVYINGSDIPDGSTVAITTAEKQAKVIYVVADPSQVSLTVDYSDIYNASNMVDGKWTISTKNDYASMSINALGDNVIVSVKNSRGTELLSTYNMMQPQASIYMGSVDSGETITITCGKLSELRTTHVSLQVIDGTADQIRVTRNSSYEAIPESQFGDIALIPSTELPLGIEAATYGKEIYKVEVNGVAQERNGQGFRLYNLSNGDVIKVYPNFPDNISVPVHFTFTNPDTEGAVSAVYINNKTVDEAVWRADDFTVPLGSNLGVTLNVNNYTIQSVTVNGQTIYGSSYQTNVTSETPVEFSITAQKMRDYEVTLYYVPGSIYAYLGYDENNRIDLSDSGETTVTVSPSNNMLNIKAMPGFIMSAIIDANDVSLSSPIYINSDMEIMAYAEELNRNLNCVAYLDPSQMWSYAQISLSSNNYDARMDISLQRGYNFINYSDLDRPFFLGLYPSGDVYLNGTKIENVYGAYPAFDNMEPNSVIKIFPEGTSVPVYDLTLSVAEGLNVNILADYITLLESTEAQVFGETDVLFESVTRDATPFTVRINGEALVPDADGRLVAHISADSAISVESNGSTGVSSISADDDDAPVYNLQGVKVTNPKNGIFIKNGKKIRL